jgi:DNA (cytosine-5)-methyltransferase 1
VAASTKTFISLYSGAGGLDLGFIQAGFKPLWANDLDADAIETYRRNVGRHAVCGDIGALREQIPGCRPDLVIGGPPCQGFSVAGQMRLDDPRSRHVRTFLDVVEELQPRGFVMENVKNLAINARWTGLIDELREQAEKAGYETRLWVLNASHYGVPQARERMFMVGLRDGVPQRPPTSSEASPPTVRDALAELPAAGQPGNESVCPARVTAARNPVLRRSPFAGMLFNGKGRPLNLDAPASTLPASMGGNRTPVVDQEEVEGSAEESWVVGYHRRLTAGKPPLRRIPKRMRRLTVEEAAALQAFPRDWKFHGRQSSRYRQIGNAVPPRLAAAVAAQVMADLAAGEQAAGETPAPPQLAVAA